MIIVAKSRDDAGVIREYVEGLGKPAWMLEIYGEYLVVTPPGTSVELGKLSNLVKYTVNTNKEYQLASRDYRGETRVMVGDVEFGGDIVVIAGPCAVESEEQLLETARAVKRAGAHALRGGAYKPRTSPYSFQGLGEEGLRILARAREETGLPVVTEVLSPEDVSTVARYADALQVGARNAQNFPLLRKLGRQGKPVLLKRGFGNSVEEWLLAAEYVMLGGNGNVILVERGIRTFERSLRFTLDIGAIPVAKSETHLPVIADPSHAAGDRKYVIPLALASIAAGADGLLVEVHINPDKAMSDSKQQLTPSMFMELMSRVREMARSLGRKLLNE